MPVVNRYSESLLIVHQFKRTVDTLAAQLANAIATGQVTPDYVAHFIIKLSGSLMLPEQITLDFSHYGDVLTRFQFVTATADAIKSAIKEVAWVHKILIIAKLNLATPNQTQLTEALGLAFENIDTMSNKAQAKVDQWSTEQELAVHRAETVVGELVKHERYEYSDEEGTVDFIKNGSHYDMYEDKDTIDSSVSSRRSTRVPSRLSMAAHLYMAAMANTRRTVSR